MKLSLAALIASCVALMAGKNACADTLEAVLADAYNGNATIAAQRYQQRATDEELPQAEAGWRPTVNLTGSIDRGHQYFGFGLPGTPNIEDVTQRQAGLVVDQPLYRGGATTAGIDRAKATIAAGAAELATTEQTQLVLAATAYLDVFRDEGVVRLAEALVQVLTLNRHDVEATFNAGAATETDTSQAQARLDGATASRLAAVAALDTSEARFRQIVGRDAGPLEPPTALGQVPASLDEAYASALAHNPLVGNARLRLEAARHQVDVVRAGLLPKLDGLLQVQHEDDFLLKGVRLNQAQIGLQASIPLYEAGNVYAQIRAAKEGVSAAESSEVAAERQVREQTAAAWNALEAAQALQAEYHSQIAANTIALTDTEKEVTAGTRTRLDTLNAQQELFNSRVNLVGAEHDTLAAIFQLEAAEGLFTPSALGLKVPDYDPSLHLDAVAGKWWGTEPVGAVGTPDPK